MLRGCLRFVMEPQREVTPSGGTGSAAAWPQKQFTAAAADVDRQRRRSLSRWRHRPGSDATRSKTVARLTRAGDAGPTTAATDGGAAPVGRRQADERAASIRQKLDGRPWHHLHLWFRVAPRTSGTYASVTVRHRDRIRRCVSTVAPKSQLPRCGGPQRISTQANAAVCSHRRRHPSGFSGTRATGRGAGASRVLWRPPSGVRFHHPPAPVMWRLR